MESPARITVTGAAGQIGYALLFRLASGALLGKRPVILQLLEITPALAALEGVRMELNDCAFPLLHEVIVTDQEEIAFGDCDYAFLVGARPRGPGMERKDLLSANATIFSSQGQALNRHARRSVRVVVVGNPANTNALIAQHNAPDLGAGQFSAMTRLDHNRAVAMLATRTGRPVSSVNGVIIWGNHSSTQFPDLHHAEVDGKPALAEVSSQWYEQELIPGVQQRGGAIIEARGASSAASAANAALGHMHDWIHGCNGDWTSMAVPSDGSYGVGPGLIYSFPVRCANGSFEIVKDLDINAFSHSRMQISEQELVEERDAVSQLLTP